MNKIIFNSVKKIISNDFSSFKYLFKSKSKLQFVKLIKEKNNEISLREAKECVDYFYLNKNEFYSLNIIKRRKEKLEKLNKKTLLEKFLKDFKNIEEKKLLNAFMKLSNKSLDILLDELGYGK
jgi:hypothetical protein